MIVPKDIEATIYFLTTKEGGRSTPALSGYRPQFFYDGDDWVSSHFYPDVKMVNPGDTVRAYIGLASPKELFGIIHEGMDFLVREGARTVGTGKVITNNNECINAEKFIIRVGTDRVRTPHAQKSQQSKYDDIFFIQFHNDFKGEFRYKGK